MDLKHRLVFGLFIKSKTRQVTTLLYCKGFWMSYYACDSYYWRQEPNQNHCKRSKYPNITINPHA